MGEGSEGVNDDGSRVSCIALMEEVTSDNMNRLRAALMLRIFLCRLSGRLTDESTTKKRRGVEG